MSWKPTPMVHWLALLAIVCGPPARSEQTHIFFGDARQRIPASLLQGKNLPVQLGDGYVVAGDPRAGTEVSFSGDEVDRATADAVALSRGKGFQIGGGTGRIHIRYPAGVSVVEISYVDTSAIPPSDGCSVKATARTDRLKLVALDAALGGDAASRQKRCRQFFQPAISGRQSALETVITIEAFGYDEFAIHRLSLYTTYDVGHNVTFLEGPPKGRKSHILEDTGKTDDALFQTWVVGLLQARHDRQTQGTSGRPTNLNALPAAPDERSATTPTLPRDTPLFKLGLALVDDGLHREGIEALKNALARENLNSGEASTAIFLIARFLDSQAREGKVSCRPEMEHWYARLMGEYPNSGLVEEAKASLEWWSKRDKLAAPPAKELTPPVSPRSASPPLSAATIDVQELLGHPRAQLDAILGPPRSWARVDGDEYNRDFPMYTPRFGGTEYFVDAQVSARGQLAYLTVTLSREELSNMRHVPPCEEFPLTLGQLRFGMTREQCRGLLGDLTLQERRTKPGEGQELWSRVISKHGHNKVYVSVSFWEKYDWRLMNIHVNCQECMFGR